VNNIMIGDRPCSARFVAGSDCLTLRPACLPLLLAVAALYLPLHVHQCRVLDAAHVAAGPHAQR